MLTKDFKILRDLIDNIIKDREDNPDSFFAQDKNDNDHDACFLCDENYVFDIKRTQHKYSKLPRQKAWWMPKGLQ